MYISVYVSCTIIGMTTVPMIFVASNSLQEVNGDTLGDTLDIVAADTPHAVLNVLQDPHGDFVDWRTVDGDRLVMTLIGRRSDNLWVTVPINLFDNIFQVCHDPIIW
jgi:hypothetical protein